MEKYKKCPYCGQEILAEAKKCRYCWAWVNNQPEDTLLEVEEGTLTSQQKHTKDNTMAPIYFKTQEPESYQSLLQLSDLIPTKKKLDEFRVENGILTVSTQDGKTLTAPVDEVKIRVQKIDKYDRREVFVRNGDNKVQFMEVPGMLSQLEWKTLFATIESFPNYGETVAGKIYRIVAIIVVVLGAIVALWSSLSK